MNGGKTLKRNIDCRIKMTQTCSRVGSNLAGRVGSGRKTLTGPDPTHETITYPTSDVFRTYLHARGSDEDVFRAQRGAFYRLDTLNIDV